MNEKADREKQARQALDALATTGGTVREEAYPEFADQTAINDWVRSGRRTRSSR